jgi:peptidoglycan/LPS O-acetylase OafA/YrhL
MNKSRRYDIDWLRVFGMLVIFLFHCARYFDFDDWHVKNDPLDFGLSVFVGVVSQWIMPLFFILSALATWYALGKRGNRQFLNERFYRLVIPLVFGIFVLIPPQVYIERASHGQFSGSFFQFLPHYFDGWYGFGGNFAWMGLHLWYLLILFLFSLITLPLLRYFQGQRLQAALSVIAARVQGPWLILALALPISLMELLVATQLETIGRRDFGGWSPLTYLLFFLQGYLLASDMRFREGLQKWRYLSLVLVVASTVTAFILVSANGWINTPMLLMRGLISWSWLTAILGFGSNYLDFSNATLKYANQAVLPFYMLHQTVIVVIGFLIVDWHMPVIFKYLLLVVSSFVTIMALYEFVVRRVKVLRFLFGMK